MSFINNYYNQKVFTQYNGDELYDNDVTIVLVQKNINLPCWRVLNPLNNKPQTKLIFKEVSSAEDIKLTINKLKKQNLRIQGLAIFAHGCPHGVKLAENSFLVNSPVIKEKREIFKQCNTLRNALNKIEKDAGIFLISCETGHVNSQGRKCFAQSIASLASGRKVIAPTEAIPAGGVQIKWENGKLNIGFTCPRKSGLNGIMGKIANLFLGFLYYFISPTKFSRNITAHFKDFPKPSIFHQL